MDAKLFTNIPEVGHGTVMPSSCQQRIEKTIREQFHVIDNIYV